MKARRFTSLVALTALFPISPAGAQQAYKQAFLVSVIGEVSTEAKVDKLDPYFGIQLAKVIPHLRMSGDVSYTRVGKSFPGVGSVQGDSYFYGFMLDYLWGTFPDNRLSGSYLGVGAGYYWERVKWKTDIFSESFEAKGEGSTVAIEGIAGYCFKKAELFGSYLFYPSSENITGAVKLGIGIYLGGER